MIMNNSSYSLLSKYSIVCCQMVEKINEGKKSFFSSFQNEGKKGFFLVPYNRDIKKLISVRFVVTENF